MEARIAEQLVRGLGRLPRVLTPALVGAGLVASWAVVWGVGGSQAVGPTLHLFYVPVLLAALRFGLRGGVLAGLAAAVLAGPLLPLDTATGEPQGLAWLIRGGFFTLIGGLAGLLLQATRERFELELLARLRAEMDLPAPGPGERDLPDLRAPGPGAPGDGAVSEPVIELRARIERVLASEALTMVYQPIHRLADGALVAVEALARFHTEPRRSPDRWFAEAARVGLGTELELRAVELALTEAAGLPEDVRLNVNISPATLADLRLITLLDRFPQVDVALELTEHVAVDDYEPLAAALAALRARGARLVVDDTGAGFASLRHVLLLGPEEIKLDRSLVQAIEHDPIKRALATVLVEFARATGTVVVAEGIESVADLEAWIVLGADAAQGYLLGRPGPLRDAVAGAQRGGRRHGGTRRWGEHRGSADRSALGAGRRWSG